MGPTVAARIRDHTPQGCDRRAKGTWNSIVCLAPLWSYSLRIPLATPLSRKDLLVATIITIDHYMADRFSRKLSRLVPFFLCTLIAYSPGQANDQQGCAATVDSGQPILFPRVLYRGGHLIWGLSTRPASLGDKLLVVLWFYNPSDAPLSVMTCADIDHFWSREIEVFDSAGKRVLSRAEERRLAEEMRNPGGFVPEEPFRCWRNFGITIPPRTCLHGSFSAPEYDFARDLDDYYRLPPGRYSLVPIRRGEPERASGLSTQQGVTLPITVLDR